MTTEEFNKLVSDRCEKIQAILAKKASEYARGDRLSNFKRAAEILRKEPEVALLGMFIKHLVSIVDMVEMIDIHSAPPSAILADEKIGDAINYLILLEGLIGERIQSEELVVMPRGMKEQSKRKKR